MFREDHQRSAVAHFAAAIYGRNWREVLMAMLACFDASGHESDQPYLVVAGFVSTAKDWDDFLVAWLKRLRADGLTYFQGNQFASSSGIFDGWKEQETKRRALCADLMEIISGHAFRFFVNGVQPSELGATFTPEERRQFNINSYVLCGRSCVADLGRWLRPDGLNCNPAPELVFEDGDLGKGALADLLEKHGYPRPLFKPGKKPLQTKLGIVQPFVPLQAADWLAYESFRILKGEFSDDQSTWRWPMRQFVRMPGVPGFWMKPALDRVRADWEALDNNTAAPIVLATSYELE